jgi:hypothetical protein
MLSLELGAPRLAYGFVLAASTSVESLWSELYTRPGAVAMAARRIVANTEEGGRPYRPFRPFIVTQSGRNWARDLAGDSGDGGVKLQRGGGSGARLWLWGRLWERAARLVFAERSWI